MIGSRPYQEDRFKYEVITRPNGDHLYYFGVFDGHAGITTSDFLSRNLHIILAELLEQNDASGGQLFESNEAVLSEAFHLANKEIERLSNEENWRSGSTASVVFIDLARNEMVIGQVGDSRIILCSSGRGIAVAPEHTPHEPKESKRIRDAGGSVFVGPDGVPRLCGLLTVTRAFGDFQLKQYGLIGDPWLTTRTIQKDEDSFVILGTDGLFGLVTPQEACDIVKRARTASQAADLLVDEAQLLSSEDNTTCIVVPLYAWNKHRENDYTQMLRKFKVSHIFGSTISELPPCLASQLAQGSVHKRDLIQKLWKNFDEDGDGSVTPDELTRGLRRVGARPSQEETDLIIAMAGSSETGRITLQDFLQQFQQGDDDDYYDSEGEVHQDDEHCQHQEQPKPQPQQQQQQDRKSVV